MYLVKREGDSIQFTPKNWLGFGFHSDSEDPLVGEPPVSIVGTEPSAAAEGLRITCFFHFVVVGDGVFV